MAAYKWKNEKFKLRFKATLMFVMYDVLDWTDLFVMYKQFHNILYSMCVSSKCFNRTSKGLLVPM